MHENILLQDYFSCNKIKQNIYFIAAFILFYCTWNHGRDPQAQLYRKIFRGHCSLEIEAPTGFWGTVPWVDFGGALSPENLGTEWILGHCPWKSRCWVVSCEDGWIKRVWCDTGGLSHPQPTRGSGGALRALTVGSRVKPETHFGVYFQGHRTMLFAPISSSKSASCHI